MTAWHDFRLIGVICPARGKAVIFVASDSNTMKFALTMDGVYHLCASEMKEGNIILSAEIIVASKMTDYFVRKTLGDGDSSTPTASLVAMRRVIEDKQLIGIEIMPSYGCEFTCICHSITLEAITAPEKFEFPQS